MLLKEKLVLLGLITLISVFLVLPRCKFCYKLCIKKRKAFKLTSLLRLINSKSFILLKYA